MRVFMNKRMKALLKGTLVSIACHFKIEDKIMNSIKKLKGSVKCE